MKALVLLSGGLDSALVVKILQSQGIKVIGINFLTAFTKPIPKDLSHSLNITLKTIKCGSDYFDLLVNPRFGFGKNANPCIDCHIYMLRKAKGLLKKLNASFIATGDVLGQRSMSQNKRMLRIIETESGLKGKLLRPLSAKLLPETEIEKNNTVDRNLLLGISGRGRKVQVQLAEKFNLAGYGQPAGGCLLTDPRYSQRIKDLLKYNQINLRNIGLLKLGRHFRINKKAKLIVGRDKIDNENILKAAKKSDFVMFSPDAAGPVGLGTGNFKEIDLFLSSQIIAYYVKGGALKKSILVSREKGHFKKIFEATLQERAILDKSLI